MIMMMMMKYQRKKNDVWNFDEWRDVVMAALKDLIYTYKEEEKKVRIVDNKL